MAEFITSVGDGPVDLKEGRDWIESHKLMRPVGRENKIVYKFNFYWYDDGRVDLAEYLHRCVEELKKNKTLFIQLDMLRPVHQSQSQSEKNFSNLLQQFHNIIENIIENDFNIHNTPAELRISATWLSPLHVLTWLVVPAFLLKPFMFVETSAESSYVFELFQEVCFKVRKWILVTTEHPKKLFPLTLEIHHGTGHMFIYEDADMHSAVNMIVEYLWNITDQELCELTEVYVQESIHSKFTFLLKKKLEIKAENHKWIKNCNEDFELYGKYRDYIQNAASVAAAKGMEVYKPWEHAETFVPTIIFGKVERKQADIPLPVICVDSFRTIEEGILLSEKSQKIQFASIWTENGSTAQYIADQLKANFVWVNTYGLFNTKVPFHLTVSVKGSYIHYISGCCISGHDCFFPMCHQQAVPLEFWKSVRENNDIKSIYKSAEQSHMKWGRASNSTARCELLLRIICDALYYREQDLKILENFDCVEECVQLLYSFAYKCKEDCMQRNFENMLSITTSKSLGVVTIMCTPQSKIIDYLWIIMGAIAYGNSVVLIHASNDKLAEHVKAFFQCMTKLPKGSVNFLKYDYSINTGDFFVDKSYYWLHPCGPDITDHSVIEAVFRIDITHSNAARFKWFTESKSVFIPVK